jgi:hypothetical protein
MIRLGAFEHLLLLALVRLGDDTYGVPIREELETRTGRARLPRRHLHRAGPARTARTRTLQLGEPTPARGGKRKRCYRLTTKGSAALRDAQGAIAHMAQGIKPKLQTP